MVNSAVHMVYSTLTVVQCRSQFECEFCLDSKVNLGNYFRRKQWQAPPLISNDIRPSSIVLEPHKTGLLKQSQAPSFRQPLSRALQTDSRMLSALLLVSSRPGENHYLHSPIALR